MSKIKSFILIAGDIVLLYGALAITLFVRYGRGGFNKAFYDHLGPFSLIFIVWLIVFYLFDLYRNKNLRITPSSSQTFIFAIFAGVMASIILFYLFPGFFKLTPKTNLAIFAVVFGVLNFGWRSLLAKMSIAGGWQNRALLIGDSPVFEEISKYLHENPQIGYNAIAQIKNIKEYPAEKLEKEINKLIKKHRLNTFVIQTDLKKNPEIIKAIYKFISSEITILDLVSFYEVLLEKIPLDELDENWFIEKIITRRRIYDTFKRIIDLALGIVLFIVLTPLMILFLILIKITSRGPALFIQKRMGKNEKPFTLYKFRTMKDGGKGPLWTTNNDNRVTFIGKILRRTHLDELPQL